ncbi:hypothetical protein ARMGADRAFT_439143 [Armillaria gallica]|uniref:Uncharacterized protein n=1 Tax=Armillaria gallica TaxID=47427 RepID=A0A2H3CYA4_ARMGA|nr:hypothetical protein ARMGADRAFT_439143 [Armillaria gallica]
MADSHIDLCERDALRAYYAELVKHRDNAYMYPLNTEYSLTIKLRPHPPGHGESSCPFPHSPSMEGPTTLTLLMPSFHSDMKSNSPSLGRRRLFLSKPDPKPGQGHSEDRPAIPTTSSKPRH